MTYNIVFKGRLCSIISISSAFFLFNMLNPPQISYTTPVEIHFTAVLQSKHILREPWLCFSDYVQPSCIQVGWEKWAFIKKIVHFKKKTEDFTLQQRDTWIKLWVETGWIPFLKSAMVGTKKCSMILQSTKKIQYSQMAMEINSKRNVINQPLIKISQDTSITIPDWNC